MTDANSDTLLQWTEADAARSARWQSEAGWTAPTRVQIADDQLPADAAYRLACEGTALLWRGDFHNARQLLQALGRRVDRKPRKSALPAPAAPADLFYRHRQAQGRRARVLGLLLIELAPDYAIALRRAPDLRQACQEAWGPPTGLDSAMPSPMARTSSSRWTATSHITRPTFRGSSTRRAGPMWFWALAT